ncbi:MAG: CsbD family protein [Rhodobacteraceae bacterium]|nr:CsbD family protein [Paracoccaceae bacterium]
MNWDRIEGGWKQFAGRARQTWGNITDDEWAKVAGKRDEMIGLIQSRYGHARDVAERQVDDWASRMEG